MPPARTIQMTQLRPIRAAVRLFDGAVLVLLIACSMAEFAIAQTAMEVANRRRAQLTQNSVASTANAPDPSNLGAINASVDAAVDRRVNADRQIGLPGPSLAPLRLTAPNVNGEDEASAQIQAVTPTLLNGGRTKHYGFTTVPLSTSTWNPGSMGRRPQNAPVSRANSQRFHQEGTVSQFTVSTGLALRTLPRRVRHRFRPRRKTRAAREFMAATSQACAKRGASRKSI